MRRHEMEIADPRAIEAILQQAMVCRVAMCDGDRPYVVPLTYGYADGCLFFHSAREGRKMDVLARNPKVCFEADLVEEWLPAEQPCAWSVRYRSVIGFGRATLVDEPQEKKRALDVIMRHYGGSSYEYTEKALASVAVVKVEVEHMTGKSSHRGAD